MWTFDSVEIPPQPVFVQEVWEYFVAFDHEAFTAPGLADWLNLFGKEGWKLVSVADGRKYIFMRPRRGEE